MKSGIVLLDKPAGMTSFDCIRRLKKILNRTDMGHGGTLDKFATGLLPVLVGDGLKLVRFFLESYPALPTYWKTYSGVFEMGVSTATGDPEGEVLEQRAIGELSKTRVAQAMKSFVGAPYEQMPPKYSAKKIGGQRASDLMRDGKEPELRPVLVTIKDFECAHVDGPLVFFRVTCSKGAYVRALAEDLARRLDTVAYVKELRRDAVGDFTVGQGFTFELLEERAESAVLDLSAATAFIPKFLLLPVEAQQLKVGQFNNLTTRLSNSGFAANVYCAIQENGAPAALLELTSDKRVNFLRAF